PEPERSFRVYPTLVFDGAARVAAEPHCLERLDTFLTTPLTHHVAERRARDPSLLKNILTVATPECSIAALDQAFERAGVDHGTRRATLAWLLKYGLLRASELTTAKLAAADHAQAGPRPDSPGGDGVSRPGSTICFVTACMGQMRTLAAT